MEVFRIKITREIKLLQCDIDEIMSTALEGGINYWCRKAKVVGEYLGQYASEQISRGGTLKLYDAESDDVWELTLDKFLKGFKLWIDFIYDEYGVDDYEGDVDTGRIDAEDVDCIIQLALFGEIIFG